ncbi:MAG: 2-iminoacetate synthase ThiH [Deltaproteobacteria bacterium]|nr:2-iminoacetate synthase ThiH [Deltaproteobacteria bacterium]
MSFLNEIKKYPPQELLEQILNKKPADVEAALHAERPSIDDFQALISPAAEKYLEPMAARAHQITLRRFGNNIQMYVPIYISNECTNGCVYCGFNCSNDHVHRKTLSLEEIEQEALTLHRNEFRHVLVLTGEDPKAIGNDGLVAAIRRIRPLFSSISLEVYPMDVDGYRQMVAAGVDGLTIYQETYDPVLYEKLHPYGMKRDYRWRLETPERGGEAGLRRIGIGALLGLGNFYTETFFTGLHALYLAHRFWRTQVSVSFPRIRPAEGGFKPLYTVTDPQMVQGICAMRLLLPDAGLTLSTRESARFRDNLFPLGITQMSAGSCTAPGGYSHQDEGTGQFNIDDDRSPEEIGRVIRAKGYEAVWKDWDAAFLEQKAS